MTFWLHGSIWHESLQVSCSISKWNSHCWLAVTVNQPSAKFFLSILFYEGYLLSQTKKESASHKRERKTMDILPPIDPAEWIKGESPPENKQSSVLLYVCWDFKIRKAWEKLYMVLKVQEAVKRKRKWGPCDVTRRSQPLPGFLTSSSRSPAFRRPSWMAAPRGRMFFTYMGAEVPIGTSLEVMLKPKPSGPATQTQQTIHELKNMNTVWEYNLTFLKLSFEF